jgi:hypothetical protein
MQGTAGFSCRQRAFHAKQLEFRQGQLGRQQNNSGFMFHTRQLDSHWTAGFHTGELGFHRGQLASHAEHLELGVHAEHLLSHA